MMSFKSSHRISVARHVYLRTQQRRLRHIKSVVIRNLTLSVPIAELSGDPITMETYFTIHPVNCLDKVLYKSYPVHKSYNPSWEAVQFNPEEYEKFSGISSFILKLWIRVGNSNEVMLAFEKTIDLVSLAYLGTLVNKGSSPYPSNSVVVGMFEGYYSHPGVGGIPCAPKITHALEKLLPPQSLLEVNKLEVRDSYMYPSLLQLIGHQEALNEATAAATQAHNSVESLKKVEEGWFRRRRERELVKMRLAVLRSQLAEKEREETEERNQLCKLQDELDTKEEFLSKEQAKLMQDKEKYMIDYEEYCKKRDMLIRVRRNQLLRQKNMINEAAFTFFITELRNKFTICNVLLQNSDQLDQPLSVEQPGVALGYVAHLVHHLAQILLIPLQYEIRPKGSRSYVCDYISDEAIIDDIREFPLFLKNVERALFHYAVHLLNKDIAQIRQHCGYGMSKSMLKKTLPNLKFLLDRIISELSTQSDTISKNSLSLPSTPTRNSMPMLTSMAVPTGRHSKARERQEMEYSPTSFTPHVSFSTESDVYSSSLSSACFQPSEDGDGSILSSPSQPSQDAHSVESSEHTLAENGASTQNNMQQYPAMQNSLTERHYPVKPNRYSASFQVLPTSSAPENVSSTPHLIKEDRLTLVQCHSPIDSSSQHTVSQSFAHADLHRFKHSDPKEEMASVGMQIINERTNTSHLQGCDNASNKTTQKTFTTGTGLSKCSSLLSTQGEPLKKENQLYSNQSMTMDKQTVVASSHAFDDHQMSTNSFLTGQFHNSSQVHAVGSTSEQHTALDAVYHPQPLLEAGYQGTVFATPHRIASSKLSEKDSQGPLALDPLKRTGNDCSEKTTVNNYGQRDMLEDFVDDAKN